MARRLTLIVNPISGHPLSKRRRSIQQALNGLRPLVDELLVTEHPRQATTWARERAHDAERLVIGVGGDGTIHEVALGLIGGQASLAAWPVGSGNDFASMLSITDQIKGLTPIDIVRVFEQATISRVDVGQVIMTDLTGHTEQAFFINSMGLGLEGAVAGTVQKLRLVKGLSRYVLATLWQMLRYRPLPMTLSAPEIDVSENSPSPKLLVAIGNGRRAGGGFVLQPDASLTDGLLDLCWASDLPRSRQLTILPHVLKGTHGAFEEIHQAQLESITIACDSGMPVHLDGEWVPRPMACLEVSVQSEAIKVAGLV